MLLVKPVVLLALLMVLLLLAVPPLDRIALESQSELDRDSLQSALLAPAHWISVLLLGQNEQVHWALSQLRSAHPRLQRLL
jgi:hypothetical protein